MPAAPERFSQLRWLQNVLFVSGMMGAAILIGLGILGYGQSPALWLIAAGGFLLLTVLWWMTFSPLILKIESTLARQLGEIRDLQEQTAKQLAQLKAIAENTRISDAAKSLARRSEELEALRAAIRADARAERWDAAMNLIDEIESRFGFKEEAERIREEVDDARQDRIQAKLSEAIDVVDAHFQAHQWELAQKEIDRLRGALPDDARVLGLQDRMKALKEQHKQELKLAWDDAVRRNDTDHAIDILKELDQYLSPGEAQTLQEQARNVFKEKLLQFGVQFRFAVTEKRWSDALSIGLEIVREFPNSRMATEVREALDTLRQRAHQVAESGGQPASSPR